MTKAIRTFRIEDNNCNIVIDILRVGTRKGTYKYKIYMSRKIVQNSCYREELNKDDKRTIKLKSEALNVIKYFRKKEGPPERQHISGFTQ